MVHPRCTRYMNTRRPYLYMWHACIRVCACVPMCYPGCTLAVGMTEEQRARLKRLANTLPAAPAGTENMMWVGASDYLTETVWVWSNGSQIGTDFPWTDTEPNGGTDENCLALSQDATGLFANWIDKWCGDHFPFACMKSSWDVRIPTLVPGLIATYYDDELSYTGGGAPSATRRDFQIDWSAKDTASTPAWTLTNSEFHVRWTGFFEADAAATHYSFFTPLKTSSERVRLWLDNELVIDQWTSLSSTDPGGSVYNDFFSAQPGARRTAFVVSPQTIATGASRDISDMHDISMSYKCSDELAMCGYQLQMSNNVIYQRHLVPATRLWSANTLLRTEYLGKYFIVTPRAGTYDDGVVACQKMGGVTAQITSAEAEAAAKTAIRTALGPSTKAFIGAESVAISGQNLWTWWGQTAWLTSSFEARSKFSAKLCHTVSLNARTVGH